MTLQEFRESRREVEDIGEALNDECMMGESGYLYDDSYYIAKERDPDAPHMWWMLIGNHWEGGVLSHLEETLYNAFYGEGDE